MSKKPEKNTPISTERYQDALTTPLSEIINFGIKSTQHEVEENGPEHVVESVAISPNMKYIVIAGERFVSLKDFNTGRLIKRYLFRRSWVSSIFFSPDGKYIAIGCDDHNAKVFDIPSFKIIKKYEGHSGPVTSVFISSKGRFLVTGSSDGKANLMEFPFRTTDSLL